MKRPIAELSDGSLLKRLHDVKYAKSATDRAAKALAECKDVLVGEAPQFWLIRHELAAQGSRLDGRWHRLRAEVKRRGLEVPR